VSEGSGTARTLLRSLFDAAIASAQPERCIPPHLPAPPTGRLIVIGAGKASAAMARAVEQHWPGPLEGLVVTRYGYAVPCERIEIVEAAHPVPDAAGLRAAERMLERVRGLSARDLVLCLISGGGSALLPLPAPGLTLEDKQHINRALLASGATIREINCVRRHLSAIKGGRLAAACHRADGRRPDELRRRARDPEALPRRAAGGGRGAARERPGRERQARRSAPRGQRGAHHRDAADGALGGRARGRGGRCAGPHSR